MLRFAQHDGERAQHDEGVSGLKVIAAIQVDLEMTPLGTRSRLREELGGRSILRRTVEQVERIKPPLDIYVLCAEGQESECRRLLADSRAIVRPHNAGMPPWNGLIRTSRKWSLDGWRGGIGQTVSFDEFLDCRVLAGLLNHVQTDAVLSIPPAAPFFSPEFALKMILQRQDSDDDTRIIFSAAPPGIAGVLLDSSLVRELAQNNLPLSWIFAYQPEHPRKDMIFLPCACEVPAPLRFASGRLCADTDRSFARVKHLWESGLPVESALELRAIGEWLIACDKSHVERLPQELEFELTTEDPFPNARLRPRGHRLQRNASIDFGAVEALADELAEFDDSLVVLGGFGDPLRHPEFDEILAAIRKSRRPNGTYGLAVRTSGVDLIDEHIAAVIEHKVDVLEVLLDAWTPETYARVQSADGAGGATLEHVLSRIARIEEMRRERASVFPLIVPSFTKSCENVHELNDFYDGWMRKLGAVCIAGAGSYARQLDDRSVIPMAPATRTPCRRINSRCLVLADGRVSMCDQDFQGKHAFGSLHESSLAAIWQNAHFKQLRANHAAEKFGAYELCAACDEWHRP